MLQEPGLWKLSLSLNLHIHGCVHEGRSSIVNELELRLLRWIIPLKHRITTSGLLAQFLIGNCHVTAIAGTTPIAKFMGPTWGPSEADRWAPCWPHEFCYLGRFLIPSHPFQVTFCEQLCQQNNNTGVTSQNRFLNLAHEIINIVALTNRTSLQCLFWTNSWLQIKPPWHGYACHHDIP